MTDEAGDCRAPFVWETGGLDRPLSILMGARLGLSVVGLGIVTLLEATGRPFDEAQARGLYGTVAVGFVATACYRLALSRVRRPRRFAFVNLGTDIVFVTSLVLFSGGQDSVFSFLYMLVPVYAAMLLGRPGALGMAALVSAVYGGVLLAGYRGWLVTSPLASAEPGAILFLRWVVQTCAVTLVGALASFLAQEVHRTGAVLHQRTSDLERLRGLYQRTVDSLMSGLLTTDARGCVTSFNPEAERITGLSAAQAIGRPVEEIVPGSMGLLAASPREGGSRARMPFRNCRGETLHLGVGVYVLRDGVAPAGGHVVIFQDVTDVVHMERELRRSERLAAVGQLSAHIAHEIRNPLAAISGSIQMLEKSASASDGGDESGRLMGIVLREIDRLDRLVTHFLEYARPRPLEPGPVGLDRAVGEVLEMFQAVRPPGVEVELDLEPALRVRADAEQLRQVLWNLVLNGAQAMPEGGRLRIGAHADPIPQEGSAEDRNEAEGCGSGAEISVADDGVGIPPEVLDRIFDPFFTTKREGSGLGLPTVHRIVEDHGGSIRVESSEGGGTIVRIRLPRAEAPA